MNVKFVKSHEKKQIVEKLNEQFGISSLNYMLIRTGKEKIRAFSGSMSKDEMIELSKIANIELIGTYLIKDENDMRDLRLSFDAPLILKDQITKSIVNIGKEQFELWIRGNDLDIKTEKGTRIIKYGDDFIGCGKSNGEKIFNYVPKDRRLRK